jgi:acetate---CoA ligase (ADP-forming)
LGEEHSVSKTPANDTSGGFPPPEPVNRLRALLSPRSIAIIGASDDRTKWGGRTMRYLRKFGYSGEIYPVNPKHANVMGLRCYQNIHDLPVGVDLALVALPAHLVAGAVRELGDRGVKSAVIFGSGFGEGGMQGAALQQELKQAAAASGIRLCGPNCLGIINIRDRIVAAASSALEMSVLIDEPISIVSQSGAVGLGSVLNRGHDHGVGFCRMVSTGNEADLELADFIEYFVDDPATHVISFYAEGFQQGRRLLAAFHQALLAGKPVVGLVTGLTPEGRQVTASHTGLLAEDSRVITGVFRQFGVVRAMDLDDLYEKAATLIRCRNGGPRLAAASSSGGIGALIADLCIAAGLTFPGLADQTQVRLRALLPSFNPVGNPLDISGQFASDAPLVFSCLDALLKDPNVETCILVLTYMRYEPLVDLLLQEQFRPAKPLLILFTGGSLSMPAVVRLERSQRFPVFWRADKCVEGAADLVRYRALHSRAGVRQAQGWVWPQNAVATPKSGLRNTLSEAESRILLRRYGVLGPRERIVHSRDEAIDAAAELGYPVVLKVHGSGIAHKTEINGVAVDLRSDHEVAEVFTRLASICQQLGRPVEVLVQEMVRGVAEVLVGMTRTVRLGPVLSLAAGGTTVGLLGAPSFRAAPLQRQDVLDMIEDSGLAPILHGHRGRPAGDIAALVEVTLALNRMCLEGGGVEEVDVNPLVVREVGQGAVAVDSLVVTRTDAFAVGGIGCK